ncbi:twin-arginine translocase TatA/TatE family subunit [Streptomyces sp. NPDC048278]|uniref:twin-arginine translocase TatA/TatE family subunit n=1 Tax=Streptomyces sp. NPDC048278 TaxID=3155809 RepID=UPI00342820D8
MVRNGLEPWHLLVVGIVIVLLFGSKKLPDAEPGQPAPRVVQTAPGEPASARSVTARRPRPAERPVGRQGLAMSKPY